MLVMKVREVMRCIASKHPSGSLQMQVIAAESRRTGYTDPMPQLSELERLQPAECYRFRNHPFEQHCEYVYKL